MSAATSLSSSTAFCDRPRPEVRASVASDSALPTAARARFCVSMEIARTGSTPSLSASTMNTEEMPLDSSARR
jgi:hypothetical protein